MDKIPEMESVCMFEIWKKLHQGPQHLPREKDVWEQSM